VSSTNACGADHIVIDAKLALEESGDAIEARKHGTLDESKVALLGDVVSGASVGRQNVQQRTLYKSVGSALQDLAAATVIYESVLSSGVECPTIPFVQKMGVVQD
jgi:alanine dehydrogenase